PAPAVSRQDRPGQAPRPRHPAAGRVAPLVREMDQKEPAGRPGTSCEQRTHFGYAESTRSPKASQASPARGEDKGPRVGGLGLEAPIEEPGGRIIAPHLAFADPGEAIAPEVVPDRKSTCLKGTAEFGHQSDGETSDVPPHRHGAADSDWP